MQKSLLGAVDLVQVYQQALTNDATFAAARASSVAGRERIVQGKAGLLPGVSASAGYSRRQSEYTPDGLPSAGTQTSSGTNYSLSLSQPLFNWALWQGYEQSKLQQASSEAVFAQAQQDLISRVAQAYFDVLAAQDTLATTQAKKVATTELLASAKRNFEVGTQTITDTHEAQAAYDLDVAAEFAAQNDLENKRTALQLIIGTAPTALAPLKTGVAIPAPQPAAIEPWVSSAETQNFSVIGAKLSYELSKRSIQASRAGHYPTAGLSASLSRSVGGSDTGSLGSTGSSVGNSIGVSVNIPIFSGFAVTSRVRESIALEDRAKNDLEAARRNAAQNARQAFLGVNSGLAQVKALEAAEVSSQSAYDSNKLGYQVGVRVNIDVLNAQRQVYSTRTSLSRARYDTIISGLRLKAAAGTLKEDDLVAVNTLLQK